MDDLYNKQVDKAVPFYDPLKRLILRTLASDGVIKKDNVKTIPLLFYLICQCICVSSFNKRSDLRNLK